MESVPPSSIGSCCMAIEIKTGRASTVRVHGNPQQKQATKSCANPKVGRNNWRTQHIYWLVVYLPLWKIWVRQLGWWHSQLNGQIKNVPNHQAVIVSGFLNSLIAGGGLTLLLLFPGKLLGTQRCSCDFGSAEPRALLRTQRTLLACGLKTWPLVSPTGRMGLNGI